MYTYVGFSIGTHYIYNALEYILHKVGHYRHKYNYIYKLHILHHTKHYPPTSTQSDTFRSNYESVIAYTPPIIFILYGFYTIIPAHYFIFFVSQIGVNIYINDYIHTQVHLHKSWLEKYEWFLKVRRLHIIHHKQFNKNMSLGYDYTIDKLLNTYLE